ncbi:MAG: hypothetical protein E7082_08385 [Bacteroidales bacterium]|nr:hypothetical protein [Bacteroidales bacterium]
MKKLLLSFLTVILSTVLMQAQEVTYDFVNETYGLTRLSGNTSEYVADGTALTENGGIIATLKNNLSDATNASGVRLWSDGLRFYKGGTITIAAPEGKHIAKITMTGAKGTGTVANIGTSADASSNLTDGTWTGEANSVCFYYTATSKNQAIGTMTVTLADGEVEGGEEPGTGGDGGDGGDDTELPTVASLTDFIAAAPTTNTKITGTVTVYYQSPDKRYTFITDGTSNLQVYGSLTNAYNNGDQLTGIVGTMSAYGGMSQMVPDVASFGTATAGTPVEPKTVTLAEEIAPCDYVTLTGVNITEVSGKNATITDGTNSIAAYDRFAITLTATENATIVAIGAVYNSNKQLYIVSVNGGEQGGEDPGTGGDGGELPTVASLTDFIAAAPTTNTKITGTVTVYYQSPDKKYTFITDGTSNLQVYGSLTNAYNNGDQLTGIVGTMGAYGGMSQMVPDVASFGTATVGTPVEPKTVTLAEEIAPCDYVTLTGVNITEVSGKNATITDGTNSIAAYDRFAITLTATENATIVAIGAVFNSNKQLYIVSVNGGEQGGEDPVDPNAKGQENNPYTVEEAIALGNPGTTAQWVTGMIVGVMNYVEGTGNVFSATELTTNSNIVIASTTEDFGTNIVAVQLPAGKIREDLNLVDRPGNLGKEVSVCGDLIKYCGVTGVKNTTNYTIVGGLAPLPVGETESLTTFVEEQFSVNTKITGTVTVYYQSPDKKYTFITDGTTNLEVYAGGGLPYAYVNGDQLTGIIGKFSYYQNMPQLTPQADSFGEPTPGTAVQPVETTLATVQPADFVMIKNATITSVTADNKTTITVSDASGSRILFDRFAIGVTDATNVNILGIGAVFGEDAQLFPIEITPATDGINEITTETNGKAAIYDLQGRKLNAPVRGINIINGRKVLVK